MLERDGKVAMRHFTSNPSPVDVNGNHYMFVPQHGVSLAWVLPSDVNALLSIKAKMCCNSTPNKYRLANANDVNVHEKGSY